MSTVLVRFAFASFWLLAVAGSAVWLARMHADVSADAHALAAPAPAGEGDHDATQPAPAD